MRKSKTLIDQIVTSMTSQIKAYKPRISRIVENQEVYDVLVTLQENNTGRYAPKEIAFSYASDAGYFIDIDDITWEFGHDQTAFKNECRKLAEAINESRVVYKKRKVLGVTVSKQIIIEKRI